MLGKTCEMLTVIELLGKSRILCLCQCGNKKILNVGHFNTGKMKSCGCHWKKPFGINKEVIVYNNMMKRCHNQTDKRYKDYGAVGIHVCQEWRNSTKQFYADMGICPEGYQIDRIDNTKGYSKDNCRWVSPKENMANRSNSVIYTLYGKQYKSAHEASNELNVTQSSIYAWCKGRIAKGTYYPPKMGCSYEFVYPK